ncbi:hypothetical protein LXM94_19185 [Rhizobium sp. TRM95111]|uniref:hypothetical protein n=1 Tax=Rhizobium alarense TaxID=2846851 RepID=UPI001F2797BC|nr:hypothetical protein [Rhizobium alarense]MCF3642096.1 hypothetical protein [Rhizobium alarense]
MYQPFIPKIVGGTDRIDRLDPGPTRAAVQAEAQRRLTSAGYKAFRAREIATGRPVPAALRYLAMQIEFVADALSSRRRIPDDFDSDKYWPSHHRQSNETP